SHSVTRKPFVADLYSGASVLWRRWTFTYTHVYRSPEFEGQHDGQLFGSFSVSYTISLPAGTRARGRTQAACTPPRAGRGGPDGPTAQGPSRARCPALRPAPQRGRPRAQGCPRASGPCHEGFSRLSSLGVHQNVIVRARCSPAP